MAFANSSYTDIIATTIQNRSKVIADNVTKNNALLDRLQTRGNIKSFSGGNVIVQELSFAENGNAGWYSGYEQLPVAAQDVISAAEFSIKQCAVPVTISGLEQLQNAGRERMIDLLESRLSVAEDTMANMIAAGVYADGTGFGGKEIGGLKLLVPTNPATGSPGGISRVDYTFWRSQTLDATDTGGATTAANIQTYFNTLWAKCIRGQDKPDLIIVDAAYWGYYVASLQALQQFTSSQSANSGFVSLKFMNADVILDGGIGGNMASKEAYFLNTKYIHYRPHSARNMVALSPKARYSVNQDAEVQILAWAGNLTASGLQFQGKMVE